MADIDEIFTRKDMTFEEAVSYFKERVPVTAAKFYAIAEEYRGLAFTVSGYTKAQMLKRFYDELLAALEEGNTLSEFRANMNEFLEAEGYEGLDPLQADNIFRTNIQTAYNVGHYGDRGCRCSTFQTRARLFRLSTVRSARLWRLAPCGQRGLLACLEGHGTGWKRLRRRPVPEVRRIRGV